MSMRDIVCVLAGMCAYGIFTFIVDRLTWTRKLDDLLEECDEG